MTTSSPLPPCEAIYGLSPKGFAFWAWQGDNGKYRPFGKGESMAIEQHYRTTECMQKEQQSGSSTPLPLQLTIANQQYSIDLNHRDRTAPMLQTNAVTGKSRALLRVNKDGSVLIGGGDGQSTNTVTAPAGHPSAASAAATATGGIAGVQWAWEDVGSAGGASSSSFVPFSPAASARIERAFQADRLQVGPAAGLLVGEAAAVVHFGDMRFSCVPTGGGASRGGRVRRMEGSEVPAPPLAVRPPVASPPPPISAAQQFVAPDLSAFGVGVSTIPVATSTPTVRPSPAACSKRSRSPPMEGPQVPVIPPNAVVAPSGSLQSPQSPHSHTIGQWAREGSLLFLDSITPMGLHPIHHAAGGSSSKSSSLRIAGFDMDDTLVMSKTGKVFANGSDDWKWVHPNVPIYLRRLWLEQRCCVVIFSNQSGIGNRGWNEGKASEIRRKIVAIGNSLGIPLSAWVSTCEDEYRKPRLGMWEHCCKTLLAPLGGSSVSVDLDNSFYCGDAAGRRGPTLAGRAKDFSCSDRKFALNCKIGFKTPEMFFTDRVGSPLDAPFDWDGPSPSELWGAPKTYPQSQYHVAAHGPPNALQCVIFVGFPGSGKSTFYRRFFAPHGFAHVNRDTLKDTNKCVAAAAAALQSGRSVVIDNTSPSADDRAKYISVAKHNGATVRVFHFTVSRAMAEHLNAVRDVCGVSKRVPAMGYTMYESRFQKPRAAAHGGEHGLDEIVEIPFVADFSGLPSGVREKFYMAW